jgi:hypothetical protein
MQKNASPSDVVKMWREEEEEKREKIEGKRVCYRVARMDLLTVIGEAGYKNNLTNV